jgi:hypothetical protein
MAGASSRAKAGKRWTCILALVVVFAGCGGSAASSSQSAPPRAVSSDLRASLAGVFGGGFELSHDFVSGRAEP